MLVRKNPANCAKNAPKLRHKRTRVAGNCAIVATLADSLAEMQTRKVTILGFVILAVFTVGIYCGRTYFDHIDSERSLKGEALRLEDEFADSGGDDNIDRSQIAKVLLDYLKIIEINPSREYAYVGAANCYLILGAPREAERLRKDAKKHGLDTRELDDLIVAWSKVVPAARSAPARKRA